MCTLLSIAMTYDDDHFGQTEIIVIIM